MRMQFVPSLRILTASAGSGKTFALTLHYLSLILRNPSNFRSILALTFTNKATAEMKSRILQVLEDLANGCKQKKTNDYLELLLLEFPTWEENLVFQRAREAYEKLLHDYSHFYVLTIDGFSQQVIRSFTYELGLDAGYRVEMNLNKVKNDLTQRLYLSLNDNEGLKSWMLDHMFEQLEQGKDWSLNRKLHSLAQMIFSESFKDFDDWVAQEENTKIFDATWDSANAVQSNFEKEYLQKTREIVNHLNRLGIQASDLYYKDRNPLLKFSVVEEDNLLADYLLQKAPNLLDNPDAYQSAKKREPQVDALFDALNPLLHAWLEFMNKEYATYNLAKALRSNLRFLRILKDMSGLLGNWRQDEQAQLISDAQKLLEKIGQTPNGDPTFMWEKMGNRFRYFLFDEFQDTSHAQWRNLFPLLLNSMGEGNQPYSQHLIVGDVKQSIYRWRNGDFRILLQGIEQDIARSFHVKDTHEFINKSSLDHNFRSQPTVVGFNNTLFEALPAIVQNLVNQEVSKMFGSEVQYDFWQKNGYADLIQRAYESHHQKTNKKEDTGRVQVFGVEPKAEEVIDSSAFEKSYIVLKEWLLENKIAPKDIGILTRTKNEARELVAFIKERQQKDQLTFSINSGDALFLSGNPAVLTLIATLRSLAYPDQQYRIYLAQALFHYAQYQKKTIPEAAWMEVGTQAISRLGAWLPKGIIENWEGLSLLPLGTLIERIIQDFGFNQDHELTRFLLGFRDFVDQYHRLGFAGLQRFLTYWDEEGVDVTLPGEQQSDAIQVMTIHKSKGLDFRAVLIPMATWDFSPKYDERIWVDLQNTHFSNLSKVPLPLNEIKNSSVIQQVCEEYLYSALDSLNNLYVATTRAVEELCLIYEEIPEDSKSSPLRLGRLLKNVIRSEFTESAEKEQQALLIIGQNFGLRTPEMTGDASNFVLDHYPSANVLGSLVKKSHRDTVPVGPNLEARRFSNILHELMAEMTSIDELEARLENMIAAGLLPSSKKSWIENLIQNAWKHPQLGPLLMQNESQANEMAVVDQQGKTFRPDKVVFEENNTWIIDFKLAGHMDNEAYVQQLDRYLGFLRAMGYPNVQGFIYYFLQNELQAV